MLDIIYLCKDLNMTETFLSTVLKEEAYAEGRVEIYLLDIFGDSQELYAHESRIHHIDVRDLSEAEAFNLALKEAKGEYISFIHQRCNYQPEAFGRAMEALGKADVLSFEPINQKNDSLLHFPMKMKEEVNLISLEEKPEGFQSNLSAYLFRRSLFEGKMFDQRLVLDYDSKMLCDILDQVQSYGLMKARMKFFEADETNRFTFGKQFFLEWYTDSMDNFLIGAAGPGSSLFRQVYIYYMIRCRFLLNENEKDKAILSPDQVDTLIEKTGQALQNIDDSVIADPRLDYHYFYKMADYDSRYLAVSFLRMKYRDITINPEISTEGETLTALYRGYKIAGLKDYPLEIHSICFDGEKLSIDGFFKGYYMFGYEKIKIVAVVNKKTVIPCRQSQIYSLKKVFNRPFSKAYTLQMIMPIDKVAKIRTLDFAVEYEGKLYTLGLFMKRAMAKLSESDKSYWVFDRYILSYHANGFFVEKLTRRNHIRHEFKLYKSMMFDPYKGARKKAILLRTLFWLTKPYFSRKKIWITMDKLFKAGDNGEYLYRYIMDHKPAETEIYYVVKADSPDYVRLSKEYKTVVKYASLKHRLLALNCDLMLATHVDTLNCNAFDRRLRRFFSDLFNARTVCLAHGLTIQQIAQYQNRVFDNTELYFFASKYEVENCKKPVYDYVDQSMLKLTGHARYDGLKNKDQKIILITPTWRRGLTTGSALKGSAYDHSDSFKSSEYYKIYNNLINDKKLIKAASDKGYKIVYLLHPAMSPQLKDFEKSDAVDIIAATGNMSYEKILTESSLMVTDYSGVQFDFAYMKKPVVYYHPDSLPPQYEPGGLIYETMGFGPICKNHEEIIKALTAYIEADCQMEPVYQERVDDFFAYDDHNNCKRIFDEVVKFQNRFGKVNKYHY